MTNNDKLRTLSDILYSLGFDPDTFSTSANRIARSQEGLVLVSEMRGISVDTQASEPHGDSHETSPAAKKSDEMIAAMEEPELPVAARKGKK